MNEPWRKYPEVKPPVEGEYIVTTKRGMAGKWVTTLNWTGERWYQKAEVTAWMPKPAPYREQA